VAIRRCPYCKAIIDESQKYCNNCGTQLLFPDDETDGEDIKGEKILDEDFKDVLGEEGEEKEEIDLDDVLRGEGAFPGEEKAAGSESEELELEEPEPDEIEPEEPAAPSRKDAAALLQPERDAESEPPEASEEEAAGEAVASSGDEKPRSLSEPGPLSGAEQEPEPEAEPAPEPEPRIDRFPEKENESEIERILAAIEKGKTSLPEAEKKPPIVKPPAEMAIDPPAGLKVEDGTGLPPWARRSPDSEKPAGSDEGIAGEEISALEEEIEAEKSWREASGDTMNFRSEVLKDAAPPRSPSSTMGIPESVTKGQEGLPFLEKAETPKPRHRPIRFEAEDEEAGAEIAAAASEIDLGGEDAAREDAAEEGGEADEAASDASPKLGFFGHIKAFVFDLVLVALLWLFAAAAAAMVLDAGLFALIREASVPFGLLFLALGGGYFFLFLFFLGDTLGRRFAAAKD
jgi:hypothetical protein